MGAGIGYTCMYRNMCKTPSGRFETVSACVYMYIFVKAGWATFPSTPSNAVGTAPRKGGAGRVGNVDLRALVLQQMHFVFQHHLAELLALPLRQPRDHLFPHFRLLIRGEACKHFDDLSKVGPVSVKWKIGERGMHRWTMGQAIGIIE